jgi:UDP-N-acetylglucosamine 4,6-dehydratase
MTRFNITMQQSIDLVLWALKNSIGGEIFVPKIPSYRILDLAKAIAPNAKINIIGQRPGEKIHEELITKSESCDAVDLKKYYAILTFLIKNNTDVNNKGLLKTYLIQRKGKKLKNEFSYTSDTNNDFLSVEQIRKLIKDIDY